MAHFPFLELPPELRHKVYQYYFTLSEGYSCDPDSNKLKASDGGLLDFALISTCRLIESETKDLPLKLNVVSFSTFAQPFCRQEIGRFDYLLRAQHLMQLHILVNLGEHLTSDIYDQIGARFPWFVSALKRIVRRKAMYSLGNFSYVDYVVGFGRWNLWCVTGPPKKKIEGVTGTRYEISQAVKFVLRLVAQKADDNSLNALDPSGKGPQGHGSLLDFLDECYEPWDTPSESNLDRMGAMFHDQKHWNRVSDYKSRDEWEYGIDGCCYLSLFRYSAAAVAIRFLRSLPLEKRLSMRSMVVCEDHFAVGYQECHSHGLIPFSQENQCLHIEMRASMLANILVAGNMCRTISTFESRVSERGASIIAYDTPERVSRWLTEALATVDAGMPATRYSLLLDGGPATGLCSDIFQQVVQRDFAFYLAVEECFPDFLDQHDFNGLPRRFAEALLHLFKKTSVMRCDFDTGMLHDTQRFIDDLSNHRANLDPEIAKLTKFFKSFENPDFNITTYPEVLLNWEDVMFEHYDRLILSDRCCARERDQAIQQRNMAPN
ncbi:hypothetical protein ACHAPA_012132 [Fusarium lateritium]